MRPSPIILAFVLALGLIEAASWWWMHSKPASQADPVLVYRPVGLDRRARPLVANGVESQGSGNRDQGSVVGELDSARSSTTSALHRQPTTDNSSSSSSSFTPLPEIVSRSIPSLRCSTGTAARIDRDDGVVVHVAFFEWDLATSDNVLEAFKHLPEECMGANGMTLIKIHRPRSYEIRSQEAVGLARPLVANGVESHGNEKVTSQDSGDGDPTPQQLSSSSSIQNSKFKIQNSSSSSTSLTFDHTEFRDPAGRPIHAFKGVWVSGAKDLLGDDVRGGGDQWRQIRWMAALKRFRPAHARVAQGAVHGIANPDRAWEIFQESMLNGLRMEK